MKALRVFAACAVIAGTLVPAVVRAQNAAPKNVNPARPNILLCVADDATWAHFGAYGQKGAARTPNFDRVAREGVLFTHSFCASPSCTPSRGALLTGQSPFRLEQGGNLLSTLPAKFPVYPTLLERSGYVVGLWHKGWGPGNFAPGGYTRNPAGPPFDDFAGFLQTVPPDKPFCFWLGSNDPHRPYIKGAGRAAGIDPARVVVPPFLPDAPDVREDIADYLASVEKFDKQVGDALTALQKSGRAANTLVIITSDNGMPFPRAKCNLYDEGTRMPLAISWIGKINAPGRTVSDFVSQTDFAPTFLQAAGLPVVKAMTGRSLMPLLLSSKSGRVDRGRDRVFTGRERHDIGRKDADGKPIGYPMRAVRTDDFLYIHNFAPDRVPAGDGYKGADIDDGQAKEWLWDNRNEAAVRPFWQLAWEKRPAEELYDLKNDPAQLHNVAADKTYAADRARLVQVLSAQMQATGDPRAEKNGGVFDAYPFYTNPKKNAVPPTPTPPNAGKTASSLITPTKSVLPPCCPPPRSAFVKGKTK